MDRDIQNSSSEENTTHREGRKVCESSSGKEK
jgi:hypothetical protein